MRKAAFDRKTKETDITASIDLDGSGVAEIDTGIGFFDHMLTALAVHSGTDIKVKCKGDLNVDGHHTVEDVGIVLGKMLSEALGDCKGIARYSCAYVPMDEALVRCVMDVSGRAYLSYDKGALAGMVGAYDTALTVEFFRAVCTNAMITVHIDTLKGDNAHHICEAMFKAFARALGEAVRPTGARLLSTKGKIGS